MGRILVLRHAQSVGNVEGRWQGWADYPLSELGLDQAARAGRALAAMGAKPDLIASSDLLRAQRTAELIALALGYERPLVIDTDLRERDAGEWNGLTGEEIAASWPEELQAFREGRRAAPGGEANDHFAERSGSALRRLAGMGNAEAIVVTHGGVVHALQVALGAVAPENHGSNLCGWWTESRGALPDLALIPLSAVDLLAASTGTQRTGT